MSSAARFCPMIVAKAVAATGGPLRIADDLALTETPTTDELAALRALEAGD